MRAFRAVFRAGFLYLWSEPASVIILTIFPIVLILVLGNALEVFISGDNTLEAAPAAYVTELQQSGLYDFLSGGDTAAYITLISCDMDKAELLLESREVGAIISETASGVSIIRRSGGSTSAAIIQSMVESYQGTGAAAAIAYMDGRDPSAVAGMDISVRTAEIGGKTPSAMDYYAVTMLVMILLYTGMNGMSLFQKNMTGEFGRRLQTAPVTRGVVVSGTVAVSTVVSFLQGLVTFAFTWLVYGVYWGERIPLVLLALFVLTLFSQMLCIFVLILVQNDVVCTGILQIFFWISTFVSKGFVKTDFGAAESVFKYAPNSLAHTVIFGAIYGGNEASMTQSLLILTAVTALLAAGAYLFGRRRLV